MEGSALIRRDMNDDLEILQCTIEAVIEPTFTHAHYTYSYRLKRRNPGVSEWREVFAYPVDDFAMDYAGRGESEAEARANGLQFSVDKLSAESDKACLRIKFDGKMDDSEVFGMTYACRTKIEQISNVSWLGGRGCVWYWGVHEYPCKKWSLRLLLPKGCYLDGADPETKDRSDRAARFERANLAPSEFASGLVTFEKRVFRLPVRYSRWADRLLAYSVGVLTSLAAAIIYEIFFRR